MTPTLPPNTTPTKNPIQNIKASRLIIPRRGVFIQDMQKKEGGVTIFCGNGYNEWKIKKGDGI
jgi:hypothetical protein